MTAFAPADSTGAAAFAPPASLGLLGGVPLDAVTTATNLVVNAPVLLAGGSATESPVLTFTPAVPAVSIVGPDVAATTAAAGVVPVEVASTPRSDAGDAVAAVAVTGDAAPLPDAPAEPAEPGWQSGWYAAVALLAAGGYWLARHSAAARRLVASFRRPAFTHA